ncbi:uncharacterized protein K452DRAFT_296160 [Aplosporella prunicola CBS 121167]|uniref:F-box domain-containing protein n=1 Tax=Aplosporella prunicola CBS 121167 TaxID=1176127 RepID=A0A6A6BNC0_9PEZI|nr:uncharacterized protein K452DRAFT_296160 [Aplosporella prunicola CBS 121167]KAF2144765.1 hypothetical protein K452DRAFT_296160 [Aplosporella prunicola CBS 121167]
MESSPPSPYTEPDGLFTPPAAEESPIDRFASPSDKPAHDSRAPPSPHNHDTAPGRLPSDDPSEGDMSHPREAISKLLNGKEQEWNSIAQKKAPLQLLDLPVDILRGIIDNLPHTNDLTSLALCHSALHALTIPCIYSRFDIVWPDNAAHTEPRSGVDALTYGLATLVMGEEIFGESPAQRAYREQTSARYNRPKPTNDDPFPLPKRRRGNHFARYTKKFSLGNGPPEWVQEYLITKEGGKMLGTLVAIAVARMHNLETFVWDMPTGVLRDVWLALSSLAERDDGEDCRLERLWIRWHDNSQADITGPVVPPPLPINNLPPPPPHHAHHVSGAGVAQAPIVVPAVQPAPLLMSAMDRVEHPTFSVIPALKSLSVLDIDELPYLDEMAILIGRSQRKLRELRIGVARHVHEHERDWVNVWEGDGVQQVDHSTTWTAASKIGEKRLGGVLGILVGRVYNMRRNSESEEKLGAVDRALMAGTLSAKSNLNLPEETVLDREQDTNNPFAVPIAHPHGGMYGSQTTGTGAQALDESGHSSYSTAPSSAASSPVHGRKRHGGGASKIDRQRREQEKNLGPILNNKLKLEILELERVPLSVPVLLRAFDWTILSTLTLLNCNNHEQLWKSLRRQYTPRPMPSSYASGSPSKSPRSSMNTRYEYSLNLKKIHTNTVSSSLISFLKETLAPNSLEVLFLQEDRSYHSSVSVESIFRGPLRRHRASLKKVMIDSSERGADGHPSTRWRRWMLTRDIITFITSGRMPQLRELAVTIDYHDWHYFLQRLPQIPHVRSLYIPHVADHAHGNNIDPRELALQIVDIIALRPELEICYMGISTKCFEVLENKHPSSSESSSMTLDGSGSPFGQHVGGGGDGLGFTDDEDDVDDEEDVEEEDGEETEEGGSDEEDEPDDAFDDESDDESFVHSDDGRGSGSRLRLREILFYDDKVAIFKARHGRL